MNKDNLLKEMENSQIIWFKNKKRKKKEKNNYKNNYKKPKINN